MHLYVTARGETLQLERFMNDLSAIYLPFKYHPDEPPGRVQLAVRRVELLEIAFPEEHRTLVLNTVAPNPPNGHKHELLTMMFRKAVGAESFDDKIVRSPHVHRPFVDVTAVGIRKDGYRCRKCQKFYDKKVLCCEVPTVEDL